MFSVTRMSGRLLAMKTVDSFDDFHFEEEEAIKSQTFIDEGQPVIFCEDLEDLKSLFAKPGDIEGDIQLDIQIVEPE